MQSVGRKRTSRKATSLARQNNTFFAVDSSERAVISESAQSVKTEPDRQKDGLADRQKNQQPAVSMCGSVGG